MQFRSIVVASVATVLASALIGGTAVAGDLIDSGDIQNHTIKQRDLAPGLKAKVNRTATIGTAGAMGPAGKDGAQGPAGTDGKDGKDGKNGVSGYEIKSWDYTTVSGGGWADMGCTKDSGKVPLGGGYWFKDETVAMEKGLSVVTSMPGRMNWNTNTPDPTKPGWIVRPNKPANVNPGALTVYVICASMN